MRPNKRLKKYGKIRRILVAVLLFNFCSMALLAQRPDSLVMKPNETAKSRERVPTVRERTSPESEKIRVEKQEIIPVPMTEDSSAKAVALADSTVKKELEEGHSPKKAMIYSIVLPGLGQAYNHKYWKIPIVYGALAGAGYFIYYNTQQYRVAVDEYLDALILSSDADDRYLKYWRRNMEMSYIAIVLVDALAVVDAYVDANLFYWDVDPDLSLRVEPSIQPVLQPGGNIVNNYGFKCSLTF